LEKYVGTLQAVIVRLFEIHQRDEKERGLNVHDRDCENDKTKNGRSNYGVRGSEIEEKGIR
jgi:hypothetical protein